MLHLGSGVIRTGLDYLRLGLGSLRVRIQGLSSGLPNKLGSKIQIRAAIIYKIRWRLIHSTEVNNWYAA